MPTSRNWNVQAGLYTCLAATHTLTDLLADAAQSVCDHVPANAVFPYIVIGNMSSRPLDTQRYEGRETTAVIHSYSRKDGMKELKNIMTAVQEALHHVDFSVDDETLVMCQEISSDTFLENDGETRHGVQHFRIITESATV